MHGTLEALQGVGGCSEQLLSLPEVKQTGAVGS